MNSPFNVGQLVGQVLADPKLLELVAIWKSLNDLERDELLDSLRARAL